MKHASSSPIQPERSESFLERHAGLLLSICFHIILICLFFMFRSASFSEQRAELASALGFGEPTAAPHAATPKPAGGMAGAGGTAASGDQADQQAAGLPFGSGAAGARPRAAAGGAQDSSGGGQSARRQIPPEPQTPGGGDQSGLGKAAATYTVAAASNPALNPFHDDPLEASAGSAAPARGGEAAQAGDGQGADAFPADPADRTGLSPMPTEPDASDPSAAASLYYARELNLAAPDETPQDPDAQPPRQAPAAEIGIEGETQPPETPQAPPTPQASPTPPSQSLLYPSDPEAKLNFEAEHAATLAALKARRHQMQDVNDLQAIYGSDEIEQRLRLLRVDQIAEKTLFKTHGPGEGVIRNLEVGDVPAQELQKVYERYNIKIVIADNSRLSHDNGYLSGATTKEGTFTNVTGAGLVRVFTYGPAAVAQMARLEEAELRKRGLNPLENRVLRVIFNVVPTTEGYDLGVQKLESAPVPQSKTKSSPEQESL